ncbi:MAG: type II secretion system minor pseudopilin GspK [Chromatocurvus sp.]
MCCLPTENRPQRQAGVALVVALLVFALCATLLVAMQREFDLFYQRGANVLLGEQAHAYLRGAEALAAMALKLDYDTDLQRERPRDDLQEIWAQPSAPYALDEGGWLLGEVEDLQGRFNLNSLGGQVRNDATMGQPQYTPEQRFFIRLLGALEVDLMQATRIVDAIGDWLDADSEPRSYGAEDDFYAVQSPAYRVANRPLASVSELRAIAGITPDLFAQLRPLVTAWPRTPSLMNIHTMPVTLLQAVGGNDRLQPLALSSAQGLARQREEIGFDGVDDMLSASALSGTDTDEVAGLLGEASSWFLLSARVEIAGREQRLYSVLHRDNRQVWPVVRASGSL